MLDHRNSPRSDPWLLAIVTTLAISVPLAGPANAAKNLAVRFERLTVSDGLSSGYVNQIVQDDRGFLWFATEHGLNRYDGREIRIFEREITDPTSLAGSWIGGIFQDGAGHVWVQLVYEGLTRIDVRRGGTRRFQFDPEEPTSIPRGNYAAHTLTADGGFWLGTRVGAVSSYDPVSESFHEQIGPGGASITCLVTDEDGRVWIGTAGGGLYCHDGELRRFEAAEDGLASNDVWTMLPRQGGGVWIGTDRGLQSLASPDDPFVNIGAGLEGGVETIRSTRTVDELIWILHEGGVTRYDPRSDRYWEVPFDAEDREEVGRSTLAGGPVFELLEDSSGVVWIATQWGLFAWDPLDDSFRWHRHHPANPYSMPWGQVTDIFEDQSGVLWFSTGGGGVASFNPRQRSFDHDFYGHALRDVVGPGSVMGIARARDGKYWIASASVGLSEYDRESEQAERYRSDPDDPTTILSDQIYKLSPSRNNPDILWLAHTGGISRFDTRSKLATRYHSNPDDPRGIRSHDVRAVLEDSDGMVWIGTGQGLDRLHPKTAEIQHFDCGHGEGQLQSCTIFSLYETRDGSLWVGVAPAGLHRYDRRTNRFHQFASAGDRAVPGTIHTMLEDRQGTLWLGTFSAGLAKFDPSSGEFQYFTKAAGLPSNQIFSLLDDERGCIWFGSDRGLGCFDPVHETTATYGVEDGIQSNIFLTNSAWKDSSGELFFGGSDGFSSFFPERIEGNPHPPPVEIISVAAQRGGESYLSVPGLALGDTLELSPSFRSVRFELAALDFTNPDENQYAYLLEGFDRNWVYAGSHRVAAYRNLPPGNYVFRAKASNNDGVWSEASAGLSLWMRPPFWQTWWFYTLAGLLVVALALALHRLRVRVVTARAREIERVRHEASEQVRRDAARDIHDELGHLITRISLFGEIARQQLTGSENGVSTYLRRITETSKRLADGMGDFLWTLDPQSDALSDAFFRLKDFGDQLFRGTRIEFRVEGHDIYLDDLQLSVQARRHIIMIFKEGMHNCLKHADCREVVLGIERGATRLEISVRDDGRGFDIDEAPDGRGVFNIRERARRLDAGLSIDSEPGTGTHVRLSLPLTVLQREAPR